MKIGQAVNMCRMPRGPYLFRLELKYFMVSCGQEFETDLQFHNKLQQARPPRSENISIIYSHTYLTATVRQPTARLGKEISES